MTPLRVMVVEDERVVAMELERVLERMGCVVCASVASGQAALEASESCELDLVFMDITIEGAMDGIETSLRLRQRRNIPVVFCSSYSRTLRHRAESTDAAGYLQKPLDHDALAAVLCKVRGARGRA